MSTLRIATVTATQKRYIVQQIQFGATEKVHCWGEITSYRNLATRHGESRTFLMSAVTITTVAKTPELIEALFLQTKGSIVERGGAVRGNLYTMPIGKRI